MKSDVIISFFDSIPLWIMITPIIICSVIALAVIIERTVFYRRINHDYRLLIKNISEYIISGRIDEALMLCDRYTGVIIQIIKNFLHSGDFKDSGERIVMESSELAVRNIEKNIGFISTIATISPMFGLLGTVTGMMKSFSGLSKIGPSAHDLLAHGISEALITTAFGLLVAIPSLIFYNYMVTKNEYYIKEVERIANGLLEIESGD